MQWQKKPLGEWGKVAKNTQTFENYLLDDTLLIFMALAKKNI